MKNVENSEFMQNLSEKSENSSTRFRSNFQVFFFHLGFKRCKGWNHKWEKGLAKHHPENDSYEKGCNKKTVKKI